MQAYWLLKTEPSEFSFEDLEKKGRSVWDGVTNPLALKHLRTMKKGDAVVIYHTGGVRAAVGIGRIACDPYPDPKEKNEKLVVVDLEPVRKLKHPISLEQIKGEANLADWELVRISRLSVMPMNDVQRKTLAKLAGDNF